MNKRKVSLDEQETTINIYPKAYTEWAEYYTCIPHEIKRVKKLAESYPEDVIIDKEDDIGIFALVKSSWFPLRPPRKGRSMTDDERKAAAERLKAAKDAKKAKASSMLQ